MKTKMAVLAAVLSLLAGARAQAVGGVGFGLKAGVDFNTADYIKTDLAGMNLSDYNNQVKNRAGFIGGMFVNFPLGGILSLQPEALYVMKNWKFSDETINTSYLEIPVFAKLTLVPAGPVRPALLIGPSVSMRLASSATMELNGARYDLHVDYNNADYGAVAGVEVAISSLLLDARYNFGLADVLKGSDTTTSNRTLSLMVGLKL